MGAAACGGGGARRARRPAGAAHAVICLARVTRGRVRLRAEGRRWPLRAAACCGACSAAAATATPTNVR